MAEHGTERAASQRKQWWWGVFLVGLLLNVLYILVYIVTDNDIFLPTILILGTFLVPVTFVVYLVDRLPLGVIPVSVLGWCALWGGLIAPPLALLIMRVVEFGLGPIATGLGVGLIEEPAKLIVPLWFYARWRYRSEAAGLLIGASAGLGFAVNESMGFALRTILEAQDDIIGPLEGVLLQRALLSPAAHIAMTGIICAVLWRERERAGRATFNLKVLAAFVVVALLHALFDIVIILPGAEEAPGPEPATFVNTILMTGGGGVGALAMAIAAIITLVLFFYLLREARRALAASTSRGTLAAPSAPTESPS